MTDEEPPVMPTADEAAAAGEDRKDAPTVVRAAVWVLVGGGLTGLVGAILFFAYKSKLVADTLREHPEMSPAQLESTATGLAWWLTVGSAMFLAFFLLLGFKALGGTRKARTLLAVVGVFAAIFQYTIGRVGIVGLASALLTIVGIGMLFMPAARAYFAVSDER